MRARRARRRDRPGARGGSVGRSARAQRSSSWAATTIALQAIDRVGGREVERVGARRAPRKSASAALERLALGRAAVGGIEHAEGGVEAGRDRVRAQDPRAEAVEGGDPGAFGLARRLALAELEQARAHARAQLAGRLVGEGDGQHLVGAQAVVRRTEATKRSTSTDVLPEPALADSMRSPSRRAMACSLLGGEGAGHADAASQRQIVGCAQPPPTRTRSGRGPARPSGCRAPPAARRRAPPAGARRTPSGARRSLPTLAQAGVGAVEQQPARAPVVVAAQRLVEPADRLEAEQLRQRQQVEADLEARVARSTWPAAAPPCPCSRRRSPRAPPALTSMRSMRPCSRSSPPASSAGARASSGPPKRSSNSRGAKADWPRAPPARRSAAGRPPGAAAPSAGARGWARCARRRRAHRGRARRSARASSRRSGVSGPPVGQRAQRVLEDAVGEVAAQHRLGVGLERGRAAAAARRTTSPDTRRRPRAPTPTTSRAR